LRMTHASVEIILPTVHEARARRKEAPETLAALPGRQPVARAPPGHLAPVPGQIPCKLQRTAPP
jgi:hypothetical protein